MDQISIFDWIGIPEPGDTTEDETRIGRQLTWQEACSMIGQVIWKRVQMQDWHYYQAVRPEKYLVKANTWYMRGEDGEYRPRFCDRLICYDGHRQRQLIGEQYCSEEFGYRNLETFWEVKA